MQFTSKQYYNYFSQILQPLDFSFKKCSAGQACIDQAKAIAQHGLRILSPFDRYLGTKSRTKAKIRSNPDLVIFNQLYIAIRLSISATTVVEKPPLLKWSPAAHSACVLGDVYMTCDAQQQLMQNGWLSYPRLISLKLTCFAVRSQYEEKFVSIPYIAFQVDILCQNMLHSEQLLSERNSSGPKSTTVGDTFFRPTVFFLASYQYRCKPWPACCKILNMYNICDFSFDFNQKNYGQIFCSGKVNVSGKRSNANVSIAGSQNSFGGHRQVSIRASKGILYMSNSRKNAAIDEKSQKGANQKPPVQVRISHYLFFAWHCFLEMRKQH